MCIKLGQNKSGLINDLVDMDKLDAEVRNEDRRKKGSRTTKKKQADAKKRPKSAPKAQKKQQMPKPKPTKTKKAQKKKAQEKREDHRELGDTDESDGDEFSDDDGVYAGLTRKEVLSGKFDDTMADTVEAQQAEEMINDDLVHDEDDWKKYRHPVNRAENLANMRKERRKMQAIGSWHSKREDYGKY
jgi:hypothetical protein